MAQEKTENSRTYTGLFSFDPIIVVRDVLKRWHLVLAVAVLAGIVSYIWTDTKYQPEYASDTTFVVTYQGSSSTVYQNLSAASDLASVFSEVLNSSILKKTITEKLGLDQFHGKISASAIPETNLLTMKVTASEPRMAFLMSKAIIENHSIVTEQIMGDTVLEILQEPQIPTSPSNSNGAKSAMKRYALLGAAAMCVLLAAAAFLDDKVRSRTELEEKLECSTLVELPHENKHMSLLGILQKRKSSILITNPTASFRFSENIRKLRHRVEAQVPDHGGIVLVTSTLENEGKSTVTVNLALSFAQKQKKVLLIDGDLRKPACRKILGLDWKGSDFGDVVLGRCKLSTACKPMRKNSSLTLLLQRRSNMNAAKLLSPERMQSILAQAREQYDIILIDTPPMTEAADAESMAESADGTVLVVRQNAAKTSALRRTVESLESSGGKFLGCVLNDVQMSWMSNQGGYGRRYGYGYGYGYGEYGYGRYDQTGRYSQSGARSKRRKVE